MSERIRISSMIRISRMIQVDMSKRRVGRMGRYEERQIKIKGG